MLDSIKLNLLITKKRRQLPTLVQLQHWLKVLLFTGIQWMEVNISYSLMSIKQHRKIQIEPLKSKQSASVRNIIECRCGKALKNMSYILLVMGSIHYIIGFSSIDNDVIPSFLFPIFH